MAPQSPLAGTWSCNKTCRLLPNVDEELPKGPFRSYFSALLALQGVQDLVGLRFRR